MPGRFKGLPEAHHSGLTLDRLLLSRVQFLMVLASFIVFFGGSVLLVEGVDSASRKRQLAGCERGNPLRAVVFSNTKAAALETRGTPLGALYARNLAALRSVAHADQATGEVDCEAAID